VAAASGPSAAAADDLTSPDVAPPVTGCARKIASVIVFGHIARSGDDQATIGASQLALRG
jgi:hypothetical protein